jgi:uroporphyrinogen III methyltransferase/synthase
VHDRLLDPAVLDLAPRDAERIDVGKAPGGPIRQEEINALLVERGKAGEEVVRLKGGDPFVLGRGGEEAAALADAGVAFEVVPGVTSATAVPAYAGIPVTHRGLAASFTVVTGHSRHGAEVDPDWASLARAGGTVVVLMGVAHRAEIASRLMEGGLSAQTPVAAISRGTYARQRTIRTTLTELGGADVEPTAVIVIGAVAALDLSWFEQRPLLGRRVVVTREATRATELAAELRAAGAEAVLVPVTETRPPADGGAVLRYALRDVAGFEWIAVTSARAVEAMFAELRDARDLAGVRIVAVGPATARALSERGVKADFVPERPSAAGLVDELPAPAGSGLVLLPQATGARPELAAGLRAAGWDVVTAEAYRTEPIRPAPEALEAARGADAITFLSPSSVDAYLAAAGPDGVPPVVACIGATTADAARAHGLDVDVIPDGASPKALVDALATVLGSRS